MNSFSSFSHLLARLFPLWGIFFWILYIFLILILCFVNSWQIFFHCDCFFTLLFILMCRSFVISCNPNCQFLLSFPELFRMFTPRFEVFPLCFLVVVSKIQVLYWSLWYLINWFLYRVKDRNPVFYIFISFFQHQLLDCLFFQHSFWHLHQESDGWVAWAYFGIFHCITLVYMFLGLSF
jgi:hypothetical protein